MRRVWAAALVLFIVLILALAPRLFLVPRLSAEMAGQLAAALNTDEVDLEIGAPLGWELLLGRIPHFEVTAADARLGGLGISEWNWRTAFSSSPGLFSRRGISAHGLRGAAGMAAHR